MRKSTLYFTLALFFIALTSFISAPLSKTADAGNAHVNGGGTAAELGEISTFTVNALKKKDGSVQGHVTYHVRGMDFSFRMDITCMTITGNRATLAGVVSQFIGSGEPPVWIQLGMTGTFAVEDNGQGQDVDKISDVFLGVSNCGANPLTYIPISGNIDISE
jgi:hypothetical protein